MIRYRISDSQTVLADEGARFYFVDTREVMALIAYKPAVILPTTEDGGEPPQFNAQVVKYERGRLLLRLEEGIDLLGPMTQAELEVPTTKALFRLFVETERITETSEGAYIVYLIVEDIEEIQRRKQDRFEVNFHCKFVPIKEGDKPADITGRPHGLGRVTDMSLGGMQFETELDLPLGLMAQFEVRLPNGHLDLQGKIVKAVPDASGPNVYGIKFGRMDSVTSQRLNRLILHMERRIRRSRSDAGGPSRVPARPRRGTERTRARTGEWRHRRDR